MHQQKALDIVPDKMSVMTLKENLFIYCILSSHTHQIWNIFYQKKYYKLNESILNAFGVYSKMWGSIPAKGLKIVFSSFIIN